MQIMLKEIKRLTLNGIESFLAGSQELAMSVESTEAYQFIEGVLSNQRYSKLSRGDKGLIGARHRLRDDNAGPSGGKQSALNSSHLDWQPRTPRRGAAW